MDKNYTNIKERVIYFAKNQGISVETFLKNIGMTYGSFKGKAKEGTLNSDAIVKILTNYPKINIEWLLTGEGEVLKQKNAINESKKSDDYTELQKHLIEAQKKQIQHLESEIERLKIKLQANNKS